MQQQAQSSIDDSTNEMTDVFIDLDSPSLGGKKSLSQLTSTTSAPDSVIQVSTKKQSVLFQSPDGSVGLQRGKDSVPKNDVVRGLVNDMIAGGGVTVRVRREFWTTEFVSIPSTNVSSEWQDDCALGYSENNDSKA